MQQLKKWEEKLREQVGDGELLLGELGFRRTDLEELNRLWVSYFIAYRDGKINLKRKLAYIKDQLPLTFSLYLVLTGIYNYDSGDYWTHPSERLGISQNDTSKFGATFLAIASRFNLPTFDTLQVKSHKYITPILMHGGIPEPMLASYFDFLRQRTRHFEFLPDAETLIEVWRADETHTFQLVPKPIKRFVLNAGIVAEQFLEQSLELLQLDPDDSLCDWLGLPDRVVRAYRAWMARQNAVERLVTTTRIERPIPYVAPATDSVVLFLPAQRMKRKGALHRLVWEVVSDGTQKRYITDRQREGAFYRYEAIEDAPLAPAKEIYVRLLGDGELLREWQFAGIESADLHIFDPLDAESADLLTNQLRELPGERWLLYHNAHTLKVENGERGQTFALDGVWQQYTLEAWTLVGGQIECGGATLKIADEKARRQPYLHGGDPLEQIRQPKSALYTHNAPQLIIPNAKNQVHRWRVWVAPDGDSTLSTPRSFLLAQLADAIRWEEETAQVNLMDERLLGELPRGRFVVQVKGAYGRGRAFHLTILPKLRIEGLERVYYSAEDGISDLSIFCNAQLSLVEPQEGVRFRDKMLLGEVQYHISAQPEVQRIVVQVESQGVRIPLTFVPKRLRWRLASDERAAQSEPLQLVTSALAAQEQIELALPVGVSTDWYIGWKLRDANDQLIVGEPPTMRQESLSLGRIRDALQEKEIAVGQLTLVIDDGQRSFTAATVAYFFDRLDVGQMLANWRVTQQGHQIDFVWEKPSRAPNRILRLWPRIPQVDENGYEEIFDVFLREDETDSATLHFKEMPQTSFIAQILINNPWLDELAEPVVNHRDVIQLEPPWLEQWVVQNAELTELLSVQSFDDLLMFFGYLQRHGQLSQLHSLNRELCEYHEKLKPSEIIRWNRVARELGDTYMTTYAMRAALKALRRIVVTRQRGRVLTYVEQYLTANDHLLLLQHGVRDLASFKALCSDPALKPRMLASAVEFMLVALTDGWLLYDDAVETLHPVAKKAIPILVASGHEDAAALVNDLANALALTPTWIEVGSNLICEQGRFKVQGIRPKTAKSSLPICSLESDVYLQLACDGALARLDLKNRLLTFTGGEPLLCRLCGHLFTTQQLFERHNQKIHPTDQYNRPKKFKGNLRLHNLRLHTKDN